MTVCRLIDLSKVRERILQLRGRGMGVPEVALLMHVRPETVERIAPAYVATADDDDEAPSAIDALLDKWERRRVRREARREGRHQPLTWICVGDL